MPVADSNVRFHPLLTLRDGKIPSASDNLGYGSRPELMKIMWER